MAKQIEKTIVDTRPTASPLGLFDKIILAIRLEKERKQTRNLLYLFVFLLVSSLSTMPFTWLFFINQWRASGMYYFLSLFFLNFKICILLWQDMMLSIFESLPVVSFALLLINIAVLLFTARLFLHKKGLLLRYLHRN